MAIPLTKTKERQLRIARSGALQTRAVNERAGELRSTLRLDPMLDANLTLKWGPKWHADKERVAWLRRNHPEVASQPGSDRPTFGYSGGEGLSRPANRFGRVKTRSVFRDGKIVTYTLDS